MDDVIINTLSNGVIKSEPSDASPELRTNGEDTIDHTLFDEQVQESSSSRARVSPSHKMALTGSLCAVCGDISSVEGGFRRHYSVICCEACKCFFRRTVQMSRDYKCRFGANCTVGRTAENLKQVCQACRFNQCLKAGMKVDSVKKFPRKVRDDSASKKQKKSSKTSKEKQPTLDVSTGSVSNGPDSAQSNQSGFSPHSGKSESDIDLGEADLSQIKFNATSPETLMYLENANVPQLFNYSDSLENIHKDSGGSPSKASLRGSMSGGSNEDLTRSGSNPILIRSGSMSNLSAILGMAKPVTMVASPKNTAEGSVTGLIMRTQDKDQQQSIFLPHHSILSPGGWTVGKGVGGVIQSVEHLLVPGENSPYPRPSSPSKRPRIDSSSSTVDMRSYHSSPASQYTSHSAPPTPLLHPSQSQNSSRVNSPEPAHMSSVYNSHTNTPYVTPSHTPIHSPLPSPTPPHTSHFFNQQNSSGHDLLTSTLHAQTGAGSFRAPTTNHMNPINSSSMKGFMSNSSSSDMNQTPFPGFSPPNNFLTLQQPQGKAIFLPTQPTVPFRVGPLLPLVQFAANPFSQPTLAFADHHKQQLRPEHLYELSQFQGPCMSDNKNGLGSSVGKSPFTIVPIPSINKTQPPEEPENQELSQISKEAEAMGVSEGMMSAPPSARSSPVSGKSKSLATLPEANVEEVLDSLRLRIRSMFKWAKAEVAGFDDLSPLDQKALLRKTVAELVMLGFARGSIAYENMLLLGSTGAVILPSNPNTGIASVASMTLQKLVVPLKVLNISDKELKLLKEVVLFNPEASGLRNREIVRQYRKRKHIELMEYTEKNSNDPGRFGDLMCLLTPLFEVGLEVTEQLRLEQFVHEGEARIDALLLMSMISGADEMPSDQIDH